jgi:MYXO-CTERM domain-containing protein
MNFLGRLPTRSLTASAAIAGSLFVMAVARPAAAEPTYPGVIQQIYGGTCVAQCTLCHNNPQGGLGNYQPSPLDPGYVLKNAPETGEGAFFANFINVRIAQNQKPLLPAGDAALEAALKEYASAKCNAASSGPCDSDGDHVLDMNEFKDDKDPNGADLCLGPKYGCGAMIKPLPRETSAKGSATAVLALLGLGLVFARRFRR